jgi:hypothetical protein
VHGTHEEQAGVKEHIGEGVTHLLLLEGLTGVNSVWRRDDFRLAQAWQSQGPQHAAVAHAEEHLVVVFLDELELVARSPAGLLRRVLVAHARDGCRLAVDWRRSHIIGDVPEGGSRRGRSESGHGDKLGVAEPVGCGARCGNEGCLHGPRQHVFNTVADALLRWLGCFCLLSRVGSVHPVLLLTCRF